MFLLFFVGHSTGQDLPVVEFLDENSGKTYSTNNMTAAPGEFYSIDIYCTPLLRVKHMLVILALLLSFDAFFKGLYTQVQSDKAFRTQAYA